jgi:assimilatory nitrate reductase catalytic subunit
MRPPTRLIASLDAAFGLEGTPPRYDDVRRGHGIRLDRGVDAVRLAGDTAAAVTARLPARGSRRRHPRPPADAGRGDPAPSALGACTCFDVAEAEIRAVLGDPAPDALARVQQTLRCGTNCGSCLPELRRLARVAA